MTMRNAGVYLEADEHSILGDSKTRMRASGFQTYERGAL